MYTPATVKPDDATVGVIDWVCDTTGRREQGVKHLLNRERNNPLTFSLWRRQCIGGMIAKRATLAVQNGVPAVAFGPLTRGRFSSDEWKPLKSHVHAAVALWSLPASTGR